MRLDANLGQAPGDDLVYYETLIKQLCYRRGSDVTYNQQIIFSQIKILNK